MTLYITDKAKEKIKQLLNINQAIYMRLGIKGGGCIGYSYVITYEKNKISTDLLLTIDDLNVIIDYISVGLIDELNIDYSTNLNNFGFVINNTKAKHTCSCGLSFSM